MSNEYTLVSRKYQSSDTHIAVGKSVIGGVGILVIAGPCTVESEDNLMKTAAAVKKAGAGVLRGGTFKIRTSPYTFQGLGEEGLKMLQQAGKIFQIPVITEIIDPGDTELMCRYVDILQIGSRNMQNTALLKAVGSCQKPVLLKRGFSNTVDEWLAAAEYIVSAGNSQVILCERGIRTFEASTRFSLDMLSIPVIKRLSHLPVVVDPSHAAGDRALVPSLAKAAIAAGADGLMIEVNSDPDKALVDGDQCLKLEQFDDLIPELQAVAKAVGRDL